MRLSEGNPWDGAVCGAAARVLVASVDDAWFSLHLDWVEAVYPRHAVALRWLRNGVGRPRAFLPHRGQPALVVDLRELLGLQAPLGEAVRADYLVIRSGAAMLAVPVDACLGVRDLDLQRQLPLPTRVLDDGGLPIGHIVALDGRMVTVLDPNRLLSAAWREALAPFWRKAQAYQDRQARLERLWEEIRGEPSEERVAAFARLCQRTGRARAAAAARRVLGHFTGCNGNGQGVDHGHAADERVLCALAHHGRARSDGALLVDLDPGQGRIVLAGGRVVEAACDGECGRAAVGCLLARPAARVRFVEAAPERRGERTADNAVAVAIAALEGLGAERPARAA